MSLVDITPQGRVGEFHSNINDTCNYHRNAFGTNPTVLIEHCLDQLVCAQSLNKPMASDYKCDKLYGIQHSFSSISIFV